MTVADLIAALQAYPPDLEVRVDVATGHVEDSEPGHPELALSTIFNSTFGGETWVTAGRFTITPPPGAATKTVLLIA